MTAGSTFADSATILIIHGNALTSDEQSVSIDAVGRTGNQGCKVFSGSLVPSFLFHSEEQSDIGDLIFDLADGTSM